MMKDILLRSGLLHQLAGKRKRAAGGERNAAPFESRARGAAHIVKLSRLRMQVVSAFTAADVYVTTAAIQRNVALGGDVARGGIIGHQVAVKDIVGEMDLHVATQRVDLAGLLALPRVNDDRMLFADRHTTFLLLCAVAAAVP